MAVSGKKALIKVAGTAIAFVGEATTAAANLTYQITDTIKQIIDYSSAVKVHKLTTNGTAITGTTTTNIRIVAHGLVTGDLIINTTRSNAARLITFVDVDNFTVMAITGQTTGDIIGRYPTELSTAYTVDRISGTIVYGSALSRTIRVSAAYIPTSIAAECKEYKLAINGESVDVTKFQDDWLTKIQGLKSAEGSLSRWLTTDTFFSAALIAGLPVVIELYSQDTNTPDRLFAILNKVEMSAVIAGANEEAVSFESTDKMLMAYS